MKYIYFQRIRLLKNKIAAELRNNKAGQELFLSGFIIYAYFFLFLRINKTFLKALRLC